MERITAAVMFAAAGMFLGMYRSFKLKRREAYLSEILQMLEEISVRIKYKVLPVEQLLAEMSDGRFNFINKVYEKIRDMPNSGWHDAWETAATETAELNAEDRDLLLTVGKQLGSSDLNGQIAMLELNKTLFKSKLSEAAEDNRRKGKMYRSVGLLAGLGIAAIIL